MNIKLASTLIIVGVAAFVIALVHFMNPAEKNYPVRKASENTFTEELFRNIYTHSESAEFSEEKTNALLNLIAGKQRLKPEKKKLQLYLELCRKIDRAKVMIYFPDESKKWRNRFKERFYGSDQKNTPEALVEDFRVGGRTYSELALNAYQLNEVNLFKDVLRNKISAINNDRNLFSHINTILDDRVMTEEERLERYNELVSFYNKHAPEEMIPILERKTWEK